MASGKIKFVFLGECSDGAKSRFEEAQICDLTKICEFLKISIDDLDSIRYKVFDNREDKKSDDPHHSPSRASARFEDMTIYRVWKEGEDEHLPHELTHLVAHHWGGVYEFCFNVETDDGLVKQIKTKMVSLSFWQEGLSHAVDELVFNRKPIGVDKYFVDEWCQRQFSDIPKLEKCLNFKGFSGYPHTLVVPFSGSLSKFLIQSFGIEKFKTLYTKSKEIYTPRKNMTILEDTYSPDVLDKWIKYIGNNKVGFGFERFLI